MKEDANRSVLTLLREHLGDEHWPHHICDPLTYLDNRELLHDAYRKLAGALDERRAAFQRDDMAARMLLAALADSNAADAVLSRCGVND